MRGIRKLSIKAELPKYILWKFTDTRLSGIQKWTNRLAKHTLLNVPVIRPHDNGDLNICRKYTKMVALRELSVLNIVSPCEDLAQLGVGNGMGVITEFNL